MKKFTEGPWKIHDRAHLAVVGGNGYMVATCGGYSNNQRCPIDLEEEQSANVSLIASSPSMYKALERILFRCNSFLDDERDMSQDSIAAIAMICTRELKKARGEE